MLQTYSPKNDIITCAAKQDYDSFYEQEIEQRRLRRFPPFRDLYVLHITGPQESGVLESCIRLARRLFRLADQSVHGGCAL